MTPESMGPIGAHRMAFPSKEDPNPPISVTRVLGRTPGHPGESAWTRRRRDEGPHEPELCQPGSDLVMGRLVRRLERPLVGAASSIPIGMISDGSHDAEAVSG